MRLLAVAGVILLSVILVDYLRRDHLLKNPYCFWMIGFLTHLICWLVKTW